MEQLINLTSYPVKNALKILLQDKTTQENIIFATDSYSHLGKEFKEKSHINIEKLDMMVNELQPRVAKELEQQSKRTKSNAEVFTPAYICNKMNNYCDEEWFGYKNVFNTPKDTSWDTNPEKIKFPSDDCWKQYVDSRRLEITCGEAPFITSRYDATTGDTIPFEDRIGILDRKLRVVNENTDSEDEWIKWTHRAFQSVYGYEYQGDNLLIARINLLITFVDHMNYKWKRTPDDSELRKISNIIAWNIWQMDGLTGTVPLKKQKAKSQQMTIDAFFTNSENTVETKKEPVPCKITNWRSRQSLSFNSLKREAKA